MRRKFFIKTIMFFILPLLIPLVSLGGFSIYLTQGFIRDDINQSNIKSSTQIQDSVGILLNEIDIANLNIGFNTYISLNMQALLNNGFSDYDTLGITNVLKSYTDTPVNSKPYIQSIYVYYENNKGNFFVSREGVVNLNNFYDTAWYKTYISSTASMDIWVESRTIRPFNFDNKDIKIISVYKKIYSSGGTNGIGTIVINFKSDYFSTILEGITTSPNQNSFVFDKDNHVILGDGNWLKNQKIDISMLTTNNEKQFNIITKNNTFIVSATPYDRYALKYVSLVPSSSLYQISLKLGLFTLVLLFISLLLGLILSYSFTKKNYNSLSRIITTFESAENGSELPPLPSRVNDEYGFILQNVIKTFVEQSYLKVQISEKKYKLKAIEIMALQAQINPHFLFNTLKTLYWQSIALTGAQNQASKMVDHLSNILQYSLGNSDNLVSLQEEIKYAQSYIEIQKVRYKDKFLVIWEYDDSIVDYKVIKLLFQPFIENSLYHGITGKEGKSYIKIKIKANASQIRITIIDNGLGIDKLSLKKIQQRLKEDGEYFEHIGLYNTDKRLRLFYGDEHGITIRSKQGIGTVIYIVIPQNN